MSRRRTVRTIDSLVRDYFNENVVVSPSLYERLVREVPNSPHMSGRAMDLPVRSGIDVVSSPYVENDRMYMISGTHEDGVTVITDEWSGLSDQMNREVARQEAIAREAQARQIELDRRNQFGPLPYQDPVYVAMTDGTYTIQSGREIQLRAGASINANTGALSPDSLFGIDASAYAMWQGRQYYAGNAQSEPIRLSIDNGDTWITSGERFMSYGEPDEGSEGSPYKLGTEKFSKDQLIARKKGWYAFAHLPEWIVELDTGIVEFDDNDFPKYTLDRKKV